MHFSKPKIKLQPLPKSLPIKKNIQAACHSKRTISLKPIAIANQKMLKLDYLKDTEQKSGRNTKIHMAFMKQLKHESKKEFDNIILKNLQINTRKSSVNSIIHKKEGLTHQQLYQRKESNLNTYFNMRMNKLKEITKQNKRIYVRLNSQKSLYSSKNLDKSYEQNCNLSRRLSESKMSKVSSRCSISNKRSESRGSIKNKQQKNKKVTKEIKVQSHNIKDVGQGEVQRYLQIFCNNNGNRLSSDNKIRKQSLSKNLKVDKQNKDIVYWNKLQNICEQLKVKPKNKKPVSLARLL